MLPLHILSFGFVLGVTAIADKDALGWVRGKHLVLDEKRLRQYHRMVWLGLIAVVITGGLLLYPSRLYLLSDLLFDIKLLFVAILFINAILIGKLADRASRVPFRHISTREKRALFLSGAVSAFSWISAAFIAFYMFG